MPEDVTASGMSSSAQRVAQVCLAQFDEQSGSMGLPSGPFILRSAYHSLRS